MSHYRNLGGGKRDANEPKIIRRFSLHGWHAEQISGNRLWDLICWPGGKHLAVRASWLVDVKAEDGKVTPAQTEKWSDLAAKGIPVYVVRTEADVDAIVAGTAAPWGPAEKVAATRTRPSARAAVARGAAILVRRKP
jgi:hypothetical protein